jgi:hypothetical protein
MYSIYARSFIYIQKIIWVWLWIWGLSERSQRSTPHPHTHTHTLQCRNSESGQLVAGSIRGDVHKGRSFICAIQRTDVGQLESASHILVPVFLRLKSLGDQAEQCHNSGYRSLSQRPGFDPGSWQVYSTDGATLTLSMLIVNVKSKAIPVTGRGGL